MGEPRIAASTGNATVALTWQPDATETDVMRLLEHAMDEWRRLAGPKGTRHG